MMSQTNVEIFTFCLQENIDKYILFIFRNKENSELGNVADSN